MKSNALTTLENCKSELSVKGSSKDARLSRLIDSATAWIETQCNRKFVARRYNGTTVPDKTKYHPNTNVLDEDYLYFSGSTLDSGSYSYVSPSYGPSYDSRSVGFGGDTLIEQGR